MFTSIVASLVLFAPPSCSLLFGVDHVRGVTPLASGGFTARAESRTDYSVKYGDLEARAMAFGLTRLMSITWQPETLTTPVNFTCTQKRAEPPLSITRAPLIMCRQPSGEAISGYRTLEFLDSAQRRWRIQATPTELRMSVTAKGLGFLASWRERAPGAFVPMALQVGSQQTLCLVF